MLSLLLLIILFVLYSQLVGQAAYSYFPEILGKIKYKWPIGFFIILAGLTGFFLNKSDFQWVIGFGATLVATGKFSKEG